MIRSSSIAAVLLYLVVSLALSQIPGSDNDVPRELIDGVIFPVDNNVSAKGSMKYNQEVNESIDFGFVGSGKIGDLVWIDENKDGIQNEDVAKYGLSEVEIKLFNATFDILIRNTTTNESGYYQFKDLFAGEYRVKVGSIINSPTIIRDPSYRGCGWMLTRSCNASPENDSNLNNELVNLPKDNSSDLTIDFGYECGR